MPGFARADCHGDGTPIRSGSIGQEGGGGRSLGLSLHPYIAADLRAPILGGEREPGAGLPRMQGPCPVVQRQPGHADQARLGRPAGRCVGVCGAQSEYIKVRSVFCDRAESIRAQQVAVAGPRIPQACIGRTIWLAVQVPFEDQRGQAGVGGEVADRVVLGDLADAGSYGSRNMGPARRGRWRTASRSASRSSRVRPPSPVRDAAIAQPAQSSARRPPHGSLASSGQEIRKTCGVPAYLRVVIEKHRTQASRTMNAEPAQAAADRVD